MGSPPRKLIRHVPQLPLPRRNQRRRRRPASECNPSPAAPLLCSIAAGPRDCDSGIRAALSPLRRDSATGAAMVPHSATCSDWTNSQDRRGASMPCAREPLLVNQESELCSSAHECSASWRKSSVIHAILLKLNKS